MTPFETSVRFFLEVAVILGACRAAGYLGRFLGQPQVVCEMVAGVLLGPSLLGLFDGGRAQAWLFPPECRSVIYSFAQIGLALYMFLVGAEFRSDLLFSRLRSAASVSLAGIMVPFALGIAIALAYYKDAAFFGEGVTPTEACLFMGAAMSITAFPMLARIISESGLTGTRLGTLALAAGSMDDALAWCVLAVVLASFKHEPGIAAKAIGGGILYVAFALLVLRRLLGPLARGVTTAPGAAGEWPIPPGKFTFVLALLALCSWFTDSIGVYAVFGAFFLGMAMPRGAFVTQLQRMMGPLTTALLLPMFFVSSGLNTKVALLNTGPLWLMAGLVLAAACFGKFVACAAAAKLNGEPWRDSIAIGALMNSRGLMELIILNIGLERKVITQTLFSIGVIMAIVTTLMATPVFSLVYGRKRATEARLEADREDAALREVKLQREAAMST